MKVLGIYVTIVIFRQQLKGLQIFKNKLYTRELDVLVNSVIIRQKDENFLKRINNLYMKVFDGLVNSANIKQGLHRHQETVDQCVRYPCNQREYKASF